jgi:hypothetical protein
MKSMNTKKLLLLAFAVFFIMGGCNSANDPVDPVVPVVPELDPAAVPTIVTQPAISNIYIQTHTASPPLTVTATTSDDGTLSYHWYKSPSVTGPWTLVSDTKSASHAPDTTTAGLFYYYVVVVNTLGTEEKVSSYAVDVTIRPITDKPQVSVATVTKPEPPSSVDFIIDNAIAYIPYSSAGYADKHTEWFVYATETGGSPVVGVFWNSPALRLDGMGPTNDVPAGDYWLEATNIDTSIENFNERPAPSKRTKLTVLPYIAPPYTVAGKSYSVWPRTIYADLSSMPTNLIPLGNIAYNAVTDEIEIGKSSWTGYDSYPVTYPGMAILKDFLAMPGVDEGDFIRFDSDGKINLFYKHASSYTLPRSSPPSPYYFVNVDDMEIQIGTGAGEFDPSLFASSVDLWGHPNNVAFGSDCTKSIKITGSNLSTGTQLILGGFYSTVDPIPYYLYGTTYNTTPGSDYTYTYP